MPAQNRLPQDASQALNPIELGVNFIDTADTYGPEVSERLIAEAPSRCRAWSTQRTGLRQVTLISQCAREGSSVSRFRQKATRRIKPEIARRTTKHGSGLGRYRWVVERTFAWLDQFKRLLVRYDRRHEIHQAFLAIGCCLVCFRRLQNSL
jgi:transposase